MTRRRLIRIIIEHMVFDVLVSMIVSLTIAFPVMLSLGALHTQWVQIQAWGWWTTYLIVFSFLQIMSTFRLVCSDPPDTSKKSA